MVEPFTMAELEGHEALPGLLRFEPDDAWELGVLVRDRLTASGAEVTVHIVQPTGQVLFHSSLGGVTVDQDRWAARKAASVFRFGRSSALTAMLFRSAAIDPVALGWFDPADYAVEGGASAIRVEGAGVVAAIALSGLASEDDHRAGVEAVAELRARQADRRRRADEKEDDR